MFNNIGEKIKTLTEIIFWIEVSIFGLIGLFLSLEAENPVPFIIIAGIGFLFSWISSFLLYGIGVLIDNSEATKELTKQQNILLNDIKTILKPTYKSSNETSHITGTDSSLESVIQDLVNGIEP